jgi:hypothetical protein
MELYDELIGLIEILSNSKIDYALCGGIAVAFYGYPRFTRDIDLLIRRERLDDILALVKKRDFTIEAGTIPIGGKGKEKTEIFRISKVDGSDLLTLDLVLVSPGLEDVWESRELFDWMGQKIQVVSREGLMKMKRVSGRDQDLLDLKMLGMNDNDQST